jgi:uncharacterized protein YggE
MKKLITSILITTLWLSASAQNNENIQRQKQINVTGVAEMEIVPDEIYVQITLREYVKKGSAKTNIETIRNNFIKAALGVGIPETDIMVQGYQGWDGNYWWYKKNRNKNPDMMASITYQVKLGNTKKMDELVQKLDDEATENFSIARVSHSKLQEFKKQLKIQAVKAAREKANYLAEAIGEKAGEAIMINEPNEVGNFPQPMYANMMMKESANARDEAAPEANIDFKKMKLQFEVSATFALK